MTRGKILFALVLVAVFIGWQNLSVFGRETAVLHIPPTVRSQDTFVTLWFVEDAQGRWLRAENRRRLWLVLLQDEQQIELAHDGRTNSYRARVSDDPETQVYVDALFREKYGPADQIRGLLPGSSVPIRLERP